MEIKCLKYLPWLCSGWGLSPEVCWLLKNFTSSYKHDWIALFTNMESLTITCEHIVGEIILIGPHHWDRSTLLLQFSLLGCCVLARFVVVALWNVFSICWASECGYNLSNNPCKHRSKNIDYTSGKWYIVRIGLKTVWLHLGNIPNNRSAARVLILFWYVLCTFYTCTIEAQEENHVSLRKPVYGEGIAVISLSGFVQTGWMKWLCDRW